MKKCGFSAVALAALIAGLVTATGASANWTFPAASGAVTDTNGSGVTITSFSSAYASNGGTLAPNAAGKAVVAAGTQCVAGNTSASGLQCGTAPGNANTYGISGFGAGATWTTGLALAHYGGAGLGLSSDGSIAPNHAIDNGPAVDGSNLVKTQVNGGLGKTESVLLNFSSSVVLTSVGIGYKFGDADISLFRYTGASAPSLSGVGADLASMQSAGWQLVGNYGDLVSDTLTPYNNVNAGNLGSSWWLVSAYNSSYGAATTGNVDQGNDYFKFYAVEGTKCTSTAAGVCGPASLPNRTPEPGSMALAGLACFGVFASRRRKVHAA